MDPSKQQVGTVLISALLMTALVAMMATALMVSQRLLIRAATRMTHADHLYLYLQGVQDWAEEVVSKNNDLQKTKSLDKSIHGVHVRGNLYAERALFNINSVRDWVQQQRFIRLLRVVVPTLSSEQASRIAKAIANRKSLMVNVREFQTTAGVTFKIYHAVKPYLTTLPTRDRLIDINYAPIPVLMTLNDRMTHDQAKALQACRHKHGLFNNTAEYLKLCVAGVPIHVPDITVQENYYRVIGQADQQSQRLSLTSMMVRSSKNIEILWQVWNEDYLTQ